MQTKTCARALAGALAALALIGGVGCGSSDDGDETTSTEAVTVALGSDPTGLDPARAINAADAIVARGLYDTLVRTDENGEIVAGLAESWRVEPAAVTFTLRRDVTCSDGSPLDARAVAASLTRLADPRTAATGAPITFGGQAARVTADDAAGTVRVAVGAPWTELLNGLTMPWAGIVCSAGLRDPASLASRSSGTGPYVIDSVARGRNIVLRAREGYDWAPELGDLGAGDAPRRITLNIVANESTAANLLLSGRLDVATLLGPDVRRLESDDEFTVLDKDAGTVWLAFNMAPGKPMADPAARRAVSQAIDRGAFVRAATNGRGTEISSVVGPNVVCEVSNEAGIPPYDPDAARTGGRDLPSLRIVGTTQLGNGAGTTYVQAALKDAGIDAELANTDTTTWSTTLFGGGDWDLTAMIVLNPTDSMIPPMSLLVGEAPPRGTNFASVQDDEFAAAFGAATTRAGGCDDWQAAQKALVDNNDVLPLSTVPTSIVLRGSTTALAPQGGLIEIGSIRVG